MLKRISFIAGFAAAMLCLCAGLGWLLFIGNANSRTSVVTVQVAGTVDEVRIYQEAKRAAPVAVIRTNGQDTTQEVELASVTGGTFLTQGSPVQYSFEIESDGSKKQGSIFCCTTGIGVERRILMIHDLDSWEVQDQ